MFKKIFWTSLLSIILLIRLSYNVSAKGKPIEISTAQKGQESYVDENGTQYVMAPLSEKVSFKVIR